MTRWLATFVLTLMMATVAWAEYEKDPFDPKIARDGWNLIGRTETAYNIPMGLLHAMSLTETGQGISGWMMPWPYTVGVNSTGQRSYIRAEHALADLATMRKIGFVRFDISSGGQYREGAKLQDATAFFAERMGNKTFTIKPQPFGRRFSSSADATAFVYRMFAMGHTNLDLGLMQINYKVHGKKFRGVSDLFDPNINVHYAANYLMEHRQTRDWWGSVGRYHSGTAFYANRYVKKVYAWYKRVHDYNSGQKVAVR